MKRKFKAVLFDMDGVIVDSMPYHFIAWFEALREYDVRVTPDIVFEMEGAKWHDVAKYVFGKNKKKLTPSIEKSVFKKKEAYFKKYFKRYIFTGIKDILAQVEKCGLASALVTGSNLSEAKEMLPKNIYNFFDAVVSGDMVKRGKPYPDPYLLAAKQLSLEPAECIVVENAPYGIKSAQSAKMFCVAVATSLPQQRLSRADKIFNSHKELYEYFRKQLQS